MVLFSSSLHPSESQEIVLGYAAPKPIERGQPLLCFRFSNLGELAKNARCAGGLSRTGGLINCIRDGGFVTGDLRQRPGSGADYRRVPFLSS
jgi:hypothetical protein